jgi:hypothetical protein
VIERPLVSSDDVLVGGDEAEPSSTGRLGRLAALALAAGLGFGAAQLAAPADEATGASLAVVTGRQPHLEETSGGVPSTAMEVTLVNTGPTALRLDAAEVEGSGLRWDVDRPLQPGRQATALLREARPCDGPSDALSGTGAAARLRVRSRDEQAGDRLPDVVLPLPPGIGRYYDDHVRRVCALPRLDQALETLVGPAALVGAELVVPFGVLPLSVRPLQVVEVEGTVPGLTARLTDADLQPVPLPLALPTRTRTQVAEGIPYDEPAGTPYRLRISTAGPGACAALQGRSDGAPFVVRYADADDPGVLAGRPLILDLAPLLAQVCAPPDGSPPR